jgi:hypothetical protein
MSQKKILVIGMLDSIHLARWLEQFTEEDISFILFPSKRFRRPHLKLQALLSKEFTAKFSLALAPEIIRFSGYFDFLANEIFKRFTPADSRARKLSRVLSSNQFNYVHAIEFQGAGYLLSEQEPKNLESNKVILTNWGSDIYYFMSFKDHLIKIKNALKIADYYSAECVRDYSLAREFGFKGMDLPCIPNAGGFELQRQTEGSIPPSARSQILIKGYGGKFGRADIPVSVIPKIFQSYPKYTYFIYSVTPDTMALIQGLPTEVRQRIRVSEVGNGLSQEEMLHEFRKSRIYIGCSESDGISTSFLEAVVNGAYPIQSGTSCANEWVQKGAQASIVNLNPERLLTAIEQALADDQLVDNAAKKNLILAERELSSEVIKRQALTFYTA